MIPKNDWDDEERAALEGLDADLEVIRRRQLDEPPVDLLAAARAEVSREPAPLDTVTEQRVWASIERTVGPHHAPHAGRTRWIAVALAAAATITIAVVINRSGEPVAPPSPAPIASTPPAAPAPPPITFTKPDVKLSPAILSWRGNDNDNAYVRDLGPALDAYRNSQYVEADSLFAAVATKYPTAIEGSFYLGIVRMLRDDFAGAIAPLTAAAALNEPTFTDDVAWYLAVAEQRSGRLSEAMRRLDQLCAAAGPRTKDACSALQLIAGPR